MKVRTWMMAMVGGLRLAGGSKTGRRRGAAALLLALCLAALAPTPAGAQDSGQLYDLIGGESVDFLNLGARIGNLDTMYRLQSEPGDVTALAGDYSRLYVLKRDGTVWMRCVDPAHDNAGYYLQVPGLSGVTKLSGREAVLRSDGSIWAWGRKCGDGTDLERSIPAPVSGLPPCVDIKGTQPRFGGPGYLALATNGTVWAWGDNYSGILGDGSTTARLSPYQVPGLNNIVAISASEHTRFAIAADGTVFGWGDGHFCEGGTADVWHNSSRRSPGQVAALSGKGVRAIYLNGDGLGRPQCNFARLADGSWLGWGNNRFRKLACNDDLEWHDTPVPAILQANGAPLPNVIHIIANGYGQTANTIDMEYALAVTADGGVWGWAQGTLIDGNNGSRYLNPTRLPWVTDVAALFFELAWDNRKMNSALVRRVVPPVEAGVATVYVPEGSTASFPVRLGAAPAANVTVSAVASGDTDLTVTSANLTFTPANWDVWQLVTVAAAEDADTIAGTATLALSVVGSVPSASMIAGEVDNDSSGADTVFAWGANPDGQLGDSTTENRLIPVRVRTGGVKLAAGMRHSLTLDASGNVWASGAGYLGQLGDGTLLQRVSTVQSLVSSITAIAGGAWVSVARRSDGSAWQMGSLASGSGSAVVPPAAVAGLNGVTNVAAGVNHALALKSDGSVWAWGQNSKGQLGDGSTTTRSAPVQVVGLSNVKAIAAGPYFSAAVTGDGRIWTWGLNGSGQLGDGTTANRSTAALVPGITNVVELAAGGGICRDILVAGYLLALKNDGTVWAWGENSNGQLGDGTTTNRLTPVQVVGLSNVKAIAAGDSHSLARTLDGRLWAWGNNGSGQLGDGTKTPRATPAQVPGIVSVTAIAAGGWHSLALGASDAAAPIAANDTYTTAANTPLIVPATGVLGNDTGNAALTAILISTPAHGAVDLNADGSFLYMPAIGFSGQDSFSYKVRCGLLESGAALVNVTVLAPNNQTPLITTAAWADPNPVGWPTGTTVRVTASDPDADTLSYAWSQPWGPGKATFAAPGAAESAVTFTCGGTYRLRVTVSDGKGGTVGSDVSVIVTGGSSTDVRADVNHDGVVNALDSQIIINNFGKSIP